MQFNIKSPDANNLEELLNSFDNSIKRDALNELASKADSQKIILPEPKMKLIYIFIHITVITRMHGLQAE